MLQKKSVDQAYVMFHFQLSNIQLSQLLDSTYFGLVISHNFQSNSNLAGLFIENSFKHPNNNQTTTIRIIYLQ